MLSILKVNIKDTRTTSGTSLFNLGIYLWEIYYSMDWENLFVQYIQS